MTRKVGGCCCCGWTEFSADMIFIKNEYNAAEQAQVRIICDNSMCKKDIKHFKFVLMRQTTTRANETGALVAPGSMVSTGSM
jgi:hypothetical protein